MSDDEGEFQYIVLFFDGVIRFYIEHAMKQKDWEVVAIDREKGTVVLRRFEEKSK